MGRFNHTIFLAISITAILLLAVGLVYVKVNVRNDPLNEFLNYLWVTVVVILVILDLKIKW